MRAAAMVGAIDATAVEAALAKAVSVVSNLRPGRWAAMLRAGARSPLRASLADGWLGLDAAVRADGPFDAAVWLRATTVLPDGVRFALAPAGLRLRADVALDDDVDLGAQIEVACRGIEAGQRLAARRVIGTAPAEVALDAEQWSAVVAHAREAGFGCADDAGASVIDLDVPDGRHRATIVGGDDGARLVVPLASPWFGTEPATSPSACRAALGALLLRTAGAVRGVRATARHDVAVDGRFEVTLGAAPAPAAVARALAALSVACRLAAPAADVLRDDEGVARAYLAHTTPEPEAARRRLPQPEEGDLR